MEIKTFSGIGEVLFERSFRAKRVNVSVRPFKPVRVAVPKGVSFSNAEQFFISQLDWVKSQQIKARRYEREHRDTIANKPAIDREEARAFLTKRLAELALQHGFRYGKVSIRNQKTRWGSCSSCNNISLNMNLMRLPADLIDYVLVHELVHTKVKDHSRRFWAQVDKLVGNSSGYRNRLRKYRLEVI